MSSSDEAFLVPVSLVTSAVRGSSKRPVETQEGRIITRIAGGGWDVPGH